MLEKRYAALRTIGTVYKIFGIITGAITILLALGLCATSLLGGAALQGVSRQFGGGGGGLLGGLITGVLGFLAVVIYGGAMSVTLYAAGEGVYLLLALEENTRQTAELLQRQIAALAPPRA